MEDIQQLRKKIDQVDEQILRLLGERATICKSIGQIKKQQKMSVSDKDREKQVYMHVREKASNLGLNQLQVEQIYRQIVNMCSRIQE